METIMSVLNKLSVLFLTLILSFAFTSPAFGEVTEKDAMNEISRYVTTGYSISERNGNTIAQLLGGKYSLSSYSVQEYIVSEILKDNDGDACIVTETGLRNYIYDAENPDSSSFDKRIYSKWATVKHMTHMTQLTANSCERVKKAIADLTSGSMKHSEISVVDSYNCPWTDVRVFHPRCLDKDDEGTTGGYEDWAVTASNSDLFKLCKVAEPDSYQFSIAQQILRQRPNARQCTGNAAAYVIAAAYNR